jgi:hypothetical protein
MQHLVKKHKIEVHPQYYSGKHILALSPQERLHLEDYSEYYRRHQDKLVPLVMKMWKLKDRYWHLIEAKQEGKLREDEEAELGEIYEKYDNMTGYEFIANEVQDTFVTDLVDNEIVTLQAMSSRNFTALQFLLDDSGWDGIFYYLGFDEHNIDGYRANNGFKSLIMAMKQHTLNELKRHGLPHKESEVFRLNHPVAEIRNQTSPVEVITEKGQKFICNKVLLAVPSGTMGKIKFGALS